MYTPETDKQKCTLSLPDPRGGGLGGVGGEKRQNAPFSLLLLKVSLQIKTSYQIATERTIYKSYFPNFLVISKISFQIVRVHQSPSFRDVVFKLVSEVPNIFK